MATPRGAGTRKKSKAPTGAGRSGGGRAKQAARVAQIVAGLERMYPEAECELTFGTPFQLLVATILSAQCTDKLVNQVTPSLFARFPDAPAMAGADVAEVEKLVSRTGFFRVKARNIVATAQALMLDHAGEVPRSMDALINLPGVARKTGNVVLGTAYGMNEGIAVDTHVARLSARLGLSTETDPKKIEQDLLALLPRDKWTQLGHQIIWHGRRVCQARKPACGECPLAPLCPSAEQGA